MRTSYKIIIIFAVLILQFLWLATPRVGPHSYRHRQRVDAAMTWLKHPSPATKAVFDKEEKLLAVHERKIQLLTVGVCWIIDILAVYFFLNYGRKRAA